MDLAASATFVAEPQEKGTMKKPPADPAEKFMNQPMLNSLFAGAASLFIAVTATYLFTWYTGSLTMSPTDAENYARTIAFATWMFGHIFLAFNFRSEKTPLLKQGVLSNKVMLLWALLVVVVLVVGTNTGFIQDALQITSLSLQDWALVIGVSFAATFWMELKKILQRST
jgi:Ca2+-transporting ATPase